MSEAECVELTLSSNYLADAAVLKDLILCFWGHILYIRNQVPLPLSNITGEALVKMINVPNQSKSKIHSNRKMSKFDNRYQSLSLSLDSLLADLVKERGKNQLKTVCVIVGPSASSSAREVHFLHFEAGGITASSIDDPTISKNQINLCKRQVIRAMISNWNSEASSSPITNSFLAINIDGSPFNISAIQQKDSTYSTINDFSLKEGFKIKIRKKSPTPFHLYVRHTCDTVEDDDVIDNNEEKESDQDVPPNFWMVLKKGIKGIKSNS